MKKTKYVILGLLQEGPLTGYDIKKIVDTKMGFFWQESYGQIYPTLDTLCTEGFIAEAADTEDKPLRREKTRYELTEKGREKLRKWLEAENEKVTVRNELLLKLFLSTAVDSAVIRKQLAKFQMQSADNLALFSELYAQLTRNFKAHSNFSHVLDVLSLGIRLQKLYVNWSAELLEKYA